VSPLTTNLTDSLRPGRNGRYLTLDHPNQRAAGWPRTRRELLLDPCLGIVGHHSHALPPSGIPESTLPPYLDLLETRYLLQRIPAWSNNLAGRVVKAPKVALLYRGLTARLLNVSALSLASDVNPDPAGHLIEIFILSKLPMQLPHTRAKLSTSGCERGINCGVDWPCQPDLAPG